MNENFVSVSGVTKDKELAWISNLRNHYEFEFPVAIGFQVSNKSIHKGTAGARQPKFSELSYLNMLARRYELVPAIHYYTKDNETILGDLEIIAKKIDMTLGPTLLQFNTLPVFTSVLKRAKEMGFDTIFKVAVSDKANGGYAVWKGDDVQDASSGNVAPLVEQARRAAPYVSYIMFDPSHGTNLGLDLDEESVPIRFGKSIRRLEEMDEVGLVYAGGIGSGNVFDVVRTLEKHIPGGVCIDAESGIMNPNNQMSKEYTMRYLVGARLGKKLQLLV